MSTDTSGLDNGKQIGNAPRSPNRINWRFVWLALAVIFALLDFASIARPLPGQPKTKLTATPQGAQSAKIAQIDAARSWLVAESVSEPETGKASPALFLSNLKLLNANDPTRLLLGTFAGDLAKKQPQLNFAKVVSAANNTLDSDVTAAAAQPTKPGAPTKTANSGKLPKAEDAVARQSRKQRASSLILLILTCICGGICMAGTFKPLSFPKLFGEADDQAPDDAVLMEKLEAAIELLHKEDFREAVKIRTDLENHRTSLGSLIRQGKPIPPRLRASIIGIFERNPILSGLKPTAPVSAEQLTAGLKEDVDRLNRTIAELTARNKQLEEQIASESLAPEDDAQTAKPPSEGIEQKEPGTETKAEVTKRQEAEEQQLELEIRLEEANRKLAEDLEQKEKTTKEMWRHVEEARRLRQQRDQALIERDRLRGQLDSGSSVSTGVVGSATGNAAQSTLVSDLEKDLAKLRDELSRSQSELHETQLKLHEALTRPMSSGTASAQSSLDLAQLRADCNRLQQQNARLQAEIGQLRSRQHAGSQWDGAHGQSESRGTPGAPPAHHDPTGGKAAELERQLADLKAARDKAEADAANVRSEAEKYGKRIAQESQAAQQALAAKERELNQTVQTLQAVNEMVASLTNPNTAAAMLKQNISQLPRDLADFASALLDLRTITLNETVRRTLFNGTDGEMKPVMSSIINLVLSPAPRATGHAQETHQVIAIQEEIAAALNRQGVDLIEPVQDDLFNGDLHETDEKFFVWVGDPNKKGRVANVRRPGIALTDGGAGVPKTVLRKALVGVYSYLPGGVNTAVNQQTSQSAASPARHRQDSQQPSSPTAKDPASAAGTTAATVADTAPGATDVAASDADGRGRPAAAEPPAATPEPTYVDPLERALKRSQPPREGS